jgi:hypothetical protein
MLIIDPAANLWIGSNFLKGLDVDLVGLSEVRVGCDDVGQRLKLANLTSQPNCELDPSLLVQREVRRPSIFS